MAPSHGKLTEITVDAADISPYCKTSDYERTAKDHDLTGYGVDDEVAGGGLRTGKFTCGGMYDNTVSVGPRNVLHGQEGTTMAIVRKIEGTGSGKPQDSFDGVLLKYAETAPHDDYVSWSAEFKMSGPVATIAQV